ncbi:MAG: ABC transporter ATP-binding protein/permease [Candidatus Kapabacteria bacterium]|nr:ABC transporter ATP-binding protein/permease [Candidatus Kapabacteria bacterium]MDW8012812.1 ABC transporter ATP-binding protein [Bacteroidota bacterium]
MATLDLLTDGEALKERSIDWSLLRRLVVFVHPYRWWVVVALVLAIVGALVTPTRPYLSKLAVDHALAAGQLGAFALLLAAVLGVVLFSALVQYALTYLLQWIGQRALFTIRMQVYDHVLRLALRFFDTTPVGRLVTRVTNDVEGLGEFFSSGLVMAIADLLLLVCIVGFMVVTEWRLALLTLLVVPLLIGASILFRVKVRTVYRQIRQQLARLNAFLSEHISGITTVQLFQQHERQFRRFERLNWKYLQLQRRSVFYYAIFFPTVDVLWAVAVVAILWYSAGALGVGSLSIGTLIAFLQYVEMFFRPIRDLTERYNILQTALVSAERIFGILGVRQHITDAPDAVPMPPLQCGIEFRQVGMSYDGITPVLRNVSFTVRKGEMVALVGATGSGKTSLVSLLCRFYEFQDGDILIDGCSIRKLQQQSLRQRIALVLQDDVLFSRTVLENITFGRPGVTEGDVWRVVRQLGIEAFISRLPQGLWTVIGERGVNLSAGERQLLALCRALVGDADIIVLDEATAHVDSQTEHLLERAIESLRREGRTCLVIAHRLSTVRQADRVVVLHRGEVREVGTHDELLERGGLYARLYRLQYAQLRAA